MARVSAALRALFAAAVAGGSAAVACPPPPPPLPTPAEQARTFWDRVDAVCLLRLDRAGLVPSTAPALERFRIADGRWQLPVLPLEGWKGDCSPGPLFFADVPYAICGGGMPPFDTLLVAGLTADRVMVVWTPADGELGLALRALAGAWPR